jgi:4-diphosphocytidyl-2-C-methyl-D-erythritol kinase
MSDTKPAEALRDVPAPAKLNLFLHIVGRRDDGMHLLQSLFVLIDWCDTLHFERRADGQLARHDLGPALPADDLCLRAARALQQVSGTRLGADIYIDKQVPWGAGLGGGSSDAATTLIALNRLWGLGLTRAELAALAAPLGADVPFFIGGQHALVEGIGERLLPVRLPPQQFLVIKPEASLATADVFRHAAVVRDTPTQNATDILAGFPAGGAKHFGRNDLEAAASLLCPEVAQALNMLKTRIGDARMSGSGSAVFAPLVGESGISGSLMAADAAQGPWPRGWTIRVCRSLDRHPLNGWLD